MKKAKTREYTFTLLVVILCLVFFALGVAVPLVFDRSGKEESVSETEKFDAVYDLLKNEWYFSDEVEDIDQTLMEQAIQGMTSLEQDPHTEYFDLESAKQFSDVLEGSNVGLGFSYFLDENDNFVLRQIFIGSPAEKAGLQKGDVITKVDGAECSSTASSKLVKRIQQSEGKSIEIEFQRGQTTKTAHIVPSEYDETVSLELNEEKGYALIALSSFSEQSGEDFAKAMGQIQKAGIHQLILDLRDNTGGYLSAALDIASSLLPKDSVVFLEEDKEGNTTEQKTNDSYGQVEMDQIVILQNESTASASEALIGALKDNLGDVVTTVGTTTYGKGTEQSTVPFSDGTSIKYTIAKWLTPKGTSIHEKGFAPDVEAQPSAVSQISYSTTEEENTIKKDTVSANASALQQFLEYLGYKVDRVDEYFSPASSEALKEFQAQNGLEATGDCDPDTWKLLKEQALLKYNKETLASDTQVEKAIEQIK